MTPKTDEKPRDLTLDILKGVGCLLMIVAHSSLNIQDYGRFKFWGGLAPILFFSVAGVTPFFQAARYRPRAVILSDVFLLLLGFSFNRITDPGFLEEIQFDLIQIIAVGAAVVYLIEYFIRPPFWVYLPLGFTAFAAKLAFMALLNENIVLGVSGILVPPGIFPVLPWLFLFFFGLFAYRVANVQNLLWTLGLGAVLSALWLLGLPLDIENKWDMSLGYFLACSILLFGSFFIARALPASWLKWMKPLEFFGRYSLLFLYVHFPLVLYMKSIQVHRKVQIIYQHPYLFWLLALLITALIMMSLLLIVRNGWLSRPFDYLITWLILTASVFIVGVFVPNEDLVYWLEIGLGLVFAAYLPSLTTRLKRTVITDPNTEPSYVTDSTYR